MGDVRWEGVRIPPPPLRPGVVMGWMWGGVPTEVGGYEEGSP